jgi:uracil phosphoribosyltransferase
MKIINLSEQNSIINQYLAEIRDVEYQKNRLLFRNNIQRIGEFEAFEISKTLNYEEKNVATPLGIAKVNMPTDKIVLATIFRAGLPFHTRISERFRPCWQCFRECISRIHRPEPHQGGHSCGISCYAKH